MLVKIRMTDELCKMCRDYPEEPDADCSCECHEDYYERLDWINEDALEEAWLERDRGL